MANSLRSQWVRRTPMQPPASLLFDAFARRSLSNEGGFVCCFPERCSKRGGPQVLTPTQTNPTNVTEKTTNTSIPRTADPMEMPAASIGVSLKTDAETLRDI